MFTVARLRNELPLVVRQSTSITIFKVQMKANYFNVAFGD